MNTYQLLTVHMGYDAGDYTIKAAADHITAELPATTHQSKIQAAVEDVKIYDHALEIGKRFFIRKRSSVAPTAIHPYILEAGHMHNQPYHYSFFFSTQKDGKTGYVLWQDKNGTTRSYQTSYDENILIPGDSAQDDGAISNYKAPYEKFAWVGRFRPGGIKYTIDRDVVEDWKQSDFMTTNGKNLLELLVLLSDNHWIALNKRCLEFAKKIANIMKGVLVGRCGVSSVLVSNEIAQKWSKLRFRCVEQIEMSTRQSPKFDPSSLADGLTVNSAILKRNIRDLAALYALSMNLTNTPILFQTVSSQMVSEGLPVLNQYAVGPILRQNDLLAEKIMSKCVQKYPDQEWLIKSTYAIKQRSYAEYLQYEYILLHTSPMANCKVEDKGQNSDSHSNTCMFNSVFGPDVAQGNIKTTKLGSINKAKEYVTYLNAMYSDIEPVLKKGSSLLDNECIMKRLGVLANDSSSDAAYSFHGEIYGNKLFPGILDDCSAMEVQCHSLGLNLEVFDARKIRDADSQKGGPSLFAYYGAGYIGSENFATAAVSFTQGHARALVSK
jgi:hypothetical protein